MFVANRRASHALACAEACAPAYLGPSGAGAIGFRHLFKSVAELLRLWRNRVEERRQLAEMTGRDRRDIGITKSDVIREINKPFWC